MLKEINQAVQVLKEGGVIIYPTEGVYGLGCDPFNETAVRRLLKIKHRNVDKGLILIAANWHQVKELINLDVKNYPVIKKTTVPTTWVFPATKKVPRWITGKFNSVAIRVTSHSVTKRLCQKFKGAIVSTSANLARQRSAASIDKINKSVIMGVDFILTAQLGNYGRPSKICEVKTGKILRI